MAFKIVEISSLQKGSYVVIDGAPCRVTDMKISRPGKHGHAKVNLTGVGLIDDKKRNMVCPGHENIESPIVEKKTAQVLSINGDNANVMDSASYETFDMQIPEELKAEVVEGCDIMYWDIMGTKVMKRVKPK